MPTNKALSAKNLDFERAWHFQTLVTCYKNAHNFPVPAASLPAFCIEFYGIVLGTCRAGFC
jgi:hypothetical protein